jgi:hypothetical protein
MWFFEIYKEALKYIWHDVLLYMNTFSFPFHLVTLEPHTLRKLLAARINLMKSLV